MNAIKFDNTTPGVSEAILIVSTLLVEMKEAADIYAVRHDIDAVKHPDKETSFPVINLRCNKLFQIIVAVSLEEKTYGVILLGYPLVSLPPFINIPREAEGLKTLIRELIEKERASWT